MKSFDDNELIIEFKHCSIINNFALVFYKANKT
jgi:hypothetical protein